MNLCEKLIEMGGKPSGAPGRLLGRLMNLGHREAYVWGLAQLPMKPDSVVLDIGCGGGAALKLLAVMVSKGRVWGIDHSWEMVNLARQVNKRFIEGGQVAVDHGSVSDLPYADEMFDVVTAFETIEFWPSLSEDLKEVRRVLKPGGQLLVVNRHPEQERDSKWTESLQIRTSGEYRERLGAEGYVDISVDDRSRPGWIAVLARKT
ncbi:MAG: class I SAM-dependent methyltransferase [Dehalococcoidia bacterium]|nr:class I SAM-dependent methyltransferase [Dehalococcoidia bacterium]